MDMKFEQYTEMITDPKEKKAIALTFEKIFPYLINEYEDEVTRANVFIAFSDMLKSIRSHGFSKETVAESPFYQVYTPFCDGLMGWLDLSENKDLIYDILEKALSDIIIETILSGIENGSIPPEALTIDPV